MLVLVSFILFKVLLASDVMEVSKLTVEDGHMVDREGRLRIYHGVNFVKKDPPWYHEPLLEPSYARDLATWGLTVVRLGTMWSGLEPREGFYDIQYLDNIKTIVNNFRDHGVSVILDMHQDVASHHFKTYDGFPDWLVEKLRIGSERPFPWPLASIENWFCGYITYEACHVYQNFYDNKFGAVDKLAQVWRVIATEMKDFDNVIGYNVLNEPWAGNVYKDGSLILPGEVGRKNLAPMYEKVNAAIREVDKETLLFWEPPTWSHWGFDTSIPYINKLLINYFKRNSALTWISGISNACGALDLSITEDDSEFCSDLKNHHLNNSNTGRQLPRAELADCFPQVESEDSPGATAFGSGLEKVPGGERNKSIMSWHYYFPLFLYDTQEYVWWQRDLAHRVFGPSVFDGAAQEISRLGGGQFLTEWGIAVPDSSRPEYWGTQESLWVMERADKESLSWCYWDTSNLGVLWHTNATKIQSAVSVLSRPYPLAVAGKEPNYSFDFKTKTFHFEFYPDKGITAPSLIFIPDHTYEGKLHIVSSEELSVSVSETDKRVLEVSLKEGTFRNTKKSWVTVGVSEEIISRNDSWMDFFLNLLPILKRK